MPLYTYKAVSPDGRSVHGRIDALNVIDLEMRLRRMELDLITGDTVSNQSMFGSSGVPRREIIHFCFHLELLVLSLIHICTARACQTAPRVAPRLRRRT